MGGCKSNWWHRPDAIVAIPAIQPINKQAGGALIDQPTTNSAPSIVNRYQLPSAARLCDRMSHAFVDLRTERDCSAVAQSSGYDRSITLVVIIAQC
jgi:hypothetical protein